VVGRELWWGPKKTTNESHRLIGGERKGKPLRLAFQAREGTGCGCGSSGLGRGNGGGGGRVVPVHVGLV
jgi:hypothetical protein